MNATEHISSQNRALWVAVVLQAKEDIEGLPLDSRDYNAAVAFLTSPSAYWRRGREEVAEHLGMTGDSILRAGSGWVIARRRLEGLPDVAPAPVPKAAKPKPVEPVETIMIPPLLREALMQRRRASTVQRLGYNPFAVSRGEAPAGQSPRRRTQSRA